MDVITRTVLYLEQENVIPKEELFDITEDILKYYVKAYAIFSKGNGKFNYSFARKLAALTFMKIKRQRGGNYINMPEGFIYIITNPAWKDYFKIGMTIDTEDRIKSYQTYSPNKDFKLERYSFVLNRRAEEKRLLSLVPEYESEWLHIANKSKVLQIFDEYSSMKL